MNPPERPAGLMIDAITSLVRRLLPCLLAFTLAGLGPAAFAVLPQALNAGSEEERPSAEHAVSVHGSAHERATRPLRHPNGLTRGAQRRLHMSVVGAPGDSPAHAISLRTLQTRIQV